MEIFNVIVYGIAAIIGFFAIAFLVMAGKLNRLLSLPPNELAKIMPKEDRRRSYDYIKYARNRLNMWGILLLFVAIVIIVVRYMHNTRKIVGGVDVTGVF